MSPELHIPFWPYVLTGTAWIALVFGIAALVVGLLASAAHAIPTTVGRGDAVKVIAAGALAAPTIGFVLTAFLWVCS